MERKTRLAMLIENAEKFAYNIMEKEEENFNVFASAGPQIDEGKQLSLIKSYLAEHGIMPKDIKNMEHYDVSEELYKILGRKNV